MKNSFGGVVSGKPGWAGGIPTDPERRGSVLASEGPSRALSKSEDDVRRLGVAVGVEPDGRRRKPGRAMTEGGRARRY